MPIYFLRHGESEANVKGLFAGQRDDSPLTALGIQQARLAAEDLKNLGITRIISSKLTRAFQTATEIANVIGFDPKQIETDDRIIEYDMGAISGTPIRKITPKEMIIADGAEKASKIRERLLSFLKEYKDSSDVILMVSHAGFYRMIKATEQGMEANKFYSLTACPNAHAVKLNLDWLN